MNNFCKKTTSLFVLLLGIILNSSLQGMKVNNISLKDITKRGLPISINFSEKNNIVVLEITNESFNTKGGSINSVHNLDKIFKEVVDISYLPANRQGCRILTCDTTINTYISLVGKKYMDIRAKNFMTYSKSILQSPLISMTSNEINFEDTFLTDTRTLNFMLDHPGSNYHIIQISFHKDPEKPTFITGSINLKDNEATQTLMLSNVKRVKLILDEKAWNDNNFYNHINKYQSMYLASFVFLFSLLLTYKNMS
jgi:hypothetical protein